MSQKALLNDIKLLGRLLGEVLQEVEGKEFFKIVEKTRLLSKQGNIKNLHRYIKKQEQLKEIAKAFSLFLNLTNGAEQYHRTRRVKYYKSKNITHQNSLEQFFVKCQKNKISSNKLKKILEELSIELVLTAHPTELKRSSLIRANKKIFELLDDK